MLVIYVCGMQGQFEAAIADYTQALALDPGHCRTLYNRASCYDRLQRLPEALADYSAAIALDQGSARAFHTRHASTCTCTVEVLLRSYVHIMQNCMCGAYRKTAQFCEAGGALQRARQSYLLLPCRAGVRERMGKQADALDDYDRAVSLDGKFAEALHARYESPRQLLTSTSKHLLR